DAVRADQPAVVCGLSMGGYVALAFYRRHRARVAGLILAATRAGADSPEAQAGRDRMAQTAREHGAGAVAEAMLPKLFAPAAYAARPELVAGARPMLAGASVDGIVSALAALRDRPDSTPRLAEITVPTLVIHGTDDQLIPPAEAEKMAAGIPGAALRLIAGAGHLLNLEQPAAFNAAVSDFMLSL
ncbi:MAG: alpha/beta fold hydrolase, partial [Anaerolineales bacterium]|nr:alpha/beta fold hydrolase [Anaerolineales bacterium]